MSARETPGCLVALDYVASIALLAWTVALYFGWVDVPSDKTVAMIAVTALALR